MKVWALSPQLCMICGNYACYEELSVCRKCVHKLQRLLNERCRNCGNTAVGCKCDSGRGIRFLFFYDSLLAHQLVYSLKTGADDRAVLFLAELAVRSSGIKPSSFDGVTYIPRLRKNIRRYGHDTAKELAQAVSEIYGIPLVVSLVRVGKGDQKLLSYSQRLKNVRDKYKLTEPPNEKYKKLLLVDDVCTTGATITACAEMLRKDHAKAVVPLVIAKTTLINQKRKL